MRKRGCTARKAKRIIGLNVSTRTVLTYLQRLGWKCIKTRYCQYVSLKNRYERFIYCRFCVIGGETFCYSIFLDECTVEMVHESKAIWYRQKPDEIKLVGKYQHEASVHILGAISRRGRSKLMIFSGNYNFAITIN